MKIFEIGCPVNFGPLITEKGEIIPTQIDFLETISARRGCCTPKFLHALENDQFLLAHTLSETGVRFTIF